MKQRIFALAAIVILAALAAGGTMAAFTSEGTARNVVRASSIEVQVVEQREGPDGVLEPYEGTLSVVPGSSVSKIVKVENIGEAAAWVRVAVDRKFELEPDAQGTTNPEHIRLVGIDDTTEWTYADGYWYYAKALEPGSVTPELFTGVDFDAQMDNTYRNAKVTVSVDAQAVQVANNGTSAQTASGWPEA